MTWQCGLVLTFPQETVVGKVEAGTFLSRFAPMIVDVEHVICPVCMSKHDPVCAPLSD